MFLPKDIEQFTVLLLKMALLFTVLTILEHGFGLEKSCDFMKPPSMICFLNLLRQS